MVLLLLLINLTLVHPYGHFCLFIYIYSFACVNANCIHFGSGMYLYWNFYIYLISFNKSILHKVQKSEPLSTFWTKRSPLKPIKTAIFNHSAV